MQDSHWTFPINFQIKVNQMNTDFEYFTDWQREVIARGNCVRACKRCIGCGKYIPVTEAPLCESCTDKITSITNAKVSTVTVIKKGDNV